MFSKTTAKNFWYKYTILRRLLQYTNKTREEIINICNSLEGKDLEQLENIHTKELGYLYKIDGRNQD